MHKITGSPEVRKSIEQTKELSAAELHKIALKEARKIDRLKFEHAVCVDKFGNVTTVSGSNCDFADISHNVLNTSRIVIHNHPHEFKEPSSFSGDDVYNLLHYGLDKIMVCGYGYYFTMKIVVSDVFNLRRLASP